MKQNNIEDNYQNYIKQKLVSTSQSNVCISAREDWCIFQETSFNVKFLKQEVALFLEKERI